MRLADPLAIAVIRVVHTRGGSQMILGIVDIGSDTGIGDDVASGIIGEEGELVLGRGGGGKTVYCYAGSNCRPLNNQIQTQPGLNR
jgi:hypothetical protein